VRRSTPLILFLSLIAQAAAQEGGGEPSALVCQDFRAEAARILARGPNSLQVNNLLFGAARKGCVRSLDELLEAGASRLSRDRMGNTALAIAARLGRLPFVDALLESPPADEAAQLDRANVAGSTPLIVAALANRGEVAKRLIEAGAKVDVVNRQGETALSAAAFNGAADLAGLLLARGAKPDTIDETGNGVIAYAAARGAEPIVAMLLDAGVDPNARYRADLTALMWAAGHPDNTSADAALRTVELLLSRGAEVELVDDRGRDALMIAAELGHAAIARALLDAGADRTLRDKTGKGAIDLATAPEVKAVIAAP